MGCPWWATVLATAGCSSVFGLGDPQPAEPDGPSASCIVAGFDLCAHQQPNGPISFDADTTIDSTLDCNVVLFDPKGGSVCVIYATDISVGATVRAQGKRPIAFAATGTITIEGAIDVSTPGNSSMTGAGGDDPACMQKRAQGTSGGGAGGSFGGKGGDGGTGVVDTVTQGLASEAIPPPDRLRGGCQGSSGASGGAVEIAASTSVSISATGKVFANGGGGRGGSSFDVGGQSIGGGGGGSGGLIQIVAPMIAIHGVVTANGGGGGQGAVGGSTGGMAGADGSMSSTAALGGAGQGAGGAGGGGTGGAIADGGIGTNGTAAMAGGGGGGGGVGFILLAGTADTTGATISPTPHQ